MEKHTLSLASPIGMISLWEVGGRIVSLGWGERARPHPSALLEEAAAQLGDYFAGQRRDFALPLAPRGTPGQGAVWEALAAIPYGQVRTYGELARNLGSGAQAVGTICGANPLPILIPCHRVITSDGRLGGYSGKGGTATKEWLLRLEGYLLI